MKQFLNRLINNPATVRKFLVAFLTAVTIAVGNGILPPEVSDWVEVVMPFLGAVGVYRLYNSKDPEQ
jgi:hypothetical protein